MLVCTGASFVPLHFTITNHAGGCRSVPLASGHTKVLGYQSPIKITLLVSDP